MKSEYYIIIKAILNEKNINADPGEVLTRVESLTGVPFGSMTVYNGITKCIQAGVYLEGVKNDFRNQRFSSPDQRP